MYKYKLSLEISQKIKYTQVKKCLTANKIKKLSKVFQKLQTKKYESSFQIKRLNETSSKLFAVKKKKNLSIPINKIFRKNKLKQFNNNLYKITTMFYFQFSKEL